MDELTLAVPRYVLSTTVNIRNGDRRRESDPKLDWIESPDAGASSRGKEAPAGQMQVPRLAEFVLEVVLEGLPLGEIVSSSNESTPQSDSLRRYVLSRLERLRPDFQRRFEDQVRLLGIERLGERGWMISRVEIEVGSLKISAALLVSLAVFTNYGAIRESIDYLHNDITTYAIPFGKELTRRALHLDVETVGRVSDISIDDRSTATGSEEAQSVVAASSEPEVARLLKQILGELGELRIALGKETSEAQGARSSNLLDKLEAPAQRRAQRVAVPE